MPENKQNEKIKNKLVKYLDHYAGHMAEHSEKINKLSTDLNSDELRAYISEATELIDKSVEKLRELKARLQ